MKEEQLLLFQETKEERLEKEIRNLRDSLEKVRKGQFAKIGELTRMYQETRHELETLKVAMCSFTTCRS